MARMIGYRIAPLLAVLALTAPVHAGQNDDENVDRRILVGTIGPYRIGMALIVRNYRTALSGHYFYVSKLIDIPLTVEQSSDDKVVLRGKDGSVFTLRQNMQGDTKSAPSFYTSYGLVGTWTDGKRTLPVAVGNDWSGGGTGGFYDWASSDAAVEAKARQFLRGVTSGDRRMAAGAVSYPLQVNNCVKKIRSPAALLANWDRIFTPSYVAELKSAIPHDMFSRNAMAMVAAGQVWFDESGAAVLNAPACARVKAPPRPAGGTRRRGG